MDECKKKRSWELIQDEVAKIREHFGPASTNQGLAMLSGAIQVPLIVLGLVARVAIVAAPWVFVGGLLYFVAGPGFRYGLSMLLRY